MTHPTEVTARAISTGRLPRRDWILLPLLSLLTICGMVAGVNLAAKGVFRGETAFHCLVPGSLLTGDYAPPNSVCRDKNYESQWTEYRFNSCGHRAGMECGPKPAGSYRIVVIGSSVAMGHLVTRENTFAALLPA